MSNMFEEVDEREESNSLAIDFDSVLYLSAYKYRENFDAEKAYMEVCKRLGAIERACYDKVANLDMVVLCLSTKSNFRHKILSTYKEGRSRSATPDSIELGKNVKALKMLVVDRLKDMVKVNNVVEADDWTNMYARKGWLISALDKDVVNSSPSDCYNYKTGKWIDGKDESDINRWYILQSIMGDSGDSIQGVHGMGKVKAEKFVNELFDGDKTADDYVELFETPEHCLITNRLVRMNQYVDGKLKLVGMEDVLNSIYPF